MQNVSKTYPTEEVSKNSDCGGSLPFEQTFTSHGKKIFRQVRAGRFFGKSTLSKPRGDRMNSSLALDWSIAQLKGEQPSYESANGSLRFVDLFCGVGGLSAGLCSAARAVGLTPEIIACTDLDPTALNVLLSNHEVEHKLQIDVSSLVDYALRFDGMIPRLAYQPEILDPVLSDQIGAVDVVIGGPPCQGHSNLNNHTRGSDLKNNLYMTVPVAGIALGADLIIIENVPAVLRDKNRVVEQAISILEAQDYHVDHAVLEADRLGVPQTRKRHFLLASKSRKVLLKDLYHLFDFDPITVWDAIGDLEEIIDPGSAFDEGADLSEENRQRIDWLFDNDVDVLPDQIRPDCHKEGHTYPSVYGRIRPNQPGSTITSGFLSPGRGRYIHPTQRRCLTPHEAARIQGFSDSFCFSKKTGEPLYRKDYTKLIGNAVPPPLGYAVGLAAIAAL
jgi:DNA (cytosine-5)-methyltransferase 1